MQRWVPRPPQTSTSGSRYFDDSSGQPGRRRRSARTSMKGISYNVKILSEESLHCLLDNVSEMSEWDFLMLQEVSWPGTTWLADSMKDGYNSCDIISDEKNKFDLCIVLSKHLSAHRSNVVSGRYSLWVRIDLPGEAFWIASVHMPHCWGEESGDKWCAAVDEIRHIMLAHNIQRYIVGMDANTEMPSQVLSMGLGRRRRHLLEYDEERVQDLADLWTQSEGSQLLNTFGDQDMSYTFRQKNTYTGFVQHRTIDYIASKGFVGSADTWFEIDASSDHHALSVVVVQGRAKADTLTFKTRRPRRTAWRPKLGEEADRMRVAIDNLIADGDTARRQAVEVAAHSGGGREDEGPGHQGQGGHGRAGREHGGGQGHGHGNAREGLRAAPGACAAMRTSLGTSGSRENSVVVLEGPSTPRVSEQHAVPHMLWLSRGDGSEGPRKLARVAEHS